MKPNEGHELKKLNMSLMFEGMLGRDKNSNYQHKMASTQLGFSWDSMVHFLDYFLRFLPKTNQSPDMHRKYWPEHLEFKVKSLVKDQTVNEANHQKSYANLWHILRGNTASEAPQTLHQKEQFTSTETQPKCDVETAGSDYLITHLLENERQYIKDMEVMVKCYVDLVESAPKWMPENLIGHKIRLFGNIEEILKFHKMVFYPELLKNHNSALEIAKLIISHIQSDSFDPYITSGILDKQTKCWRQHFQRFLTKVEKTCGKKFKPEPTEHLAKYQKFLQLIQMEVDQQSSAKMFKEAENKIHLLLVKISDAFGIYDEFQGSCHKLPVQLQIQVMNMMNQELNYDLNKPLLFIVPRYDVLSGGYQAPLGKLVECSIENVHGIERNSLVKYFVFQHCLIYTKYYKDKLLFGKCYNIRDLKIIEAHQVPLRIRIKSRQAPRFVFLDGVAIYSIILVDIIEKLQKSDATGSHQHIPLNHPAIKQMVDKIHHSTYFK
ncbi:unnamed protein product [Diamesa serratosioi]